MNKKYSNYEINENFVNEITGEKISILGEVPIDFQHHKIKRYKGIFYPNKENSLTSQICYLRKICKAIQDMSKQDVLFKIRNDRKLDLGNYLEDEAEKLLCGAKQYNLNITMDLVEE